MNLYTFIFPDELKVEYGTVSFGAEPPRTAGTSEGLDFLICDDVPDGKEYVVYGLRRAENHMQQVWCARTADRMTFSDAQQLFETPPPDNRWLAGDVAVANDKIYLMISDCGKPPKAGHRFHMFAGTRDGNWSKLNTDPVYKGQDAFSLIWHGKQFVNYQTSYQPYHKPFEDNMGDGIRRVLHIRTSPDCLEWTPGGSFGVGGPYLPDEQLITPDEQDAPETEFYKFRPFRQDGFWAGALVKYISQPPILPKSGNFPHGPFLGCEWWQCRTFSFDEYRAWFAERFPGRKPLPFTEYVLNGGDLVRDFIDACAAVDQQPLISLRLNHPPQRESEGGEHMMSSLFYDRHPEWRCGPNLTDNRRCLNWLVPEVREEKLELIRDLARHYSLAGIELDFMRYCWFFPAETDPEERGVEFYAPVESTKPQAGNPANREDPTQPVPEERREELPLNNSKKLDKSCFVYDAEADVYYRPQGHAMPFEKTKSATSGGGETVTRRVYRCPNCDGCPLVSLCVSDRNKCGRTITRDEYEASRERIASRMAKPSSRELYNQRPHMAETPFAIIKSIMGIRQFLLRGLEKVKTEWRWAATPFNLAKLVREMGKLRANLSDLAPQGGT